MRAENIIHHRRTCVSRRQTDVQRQLTALTHLTGMARRLPHCSLTPSRVSLDSRCGGRRRRARRQGQDAVGLLSGNHPAEEAGQGAGPKVQEEEGREPLHHRRRPLAALRGLQGLCGGGGLRRVHQLPGQAQVWRAQHQAAVLHVSANRYSKSKPTVH